MLRTIILLSLLSFVMSENVAGKGEACAYKRIESSDIPQLFVKVNGTWQIGDCDSGGCRDWFGMSIAKFCEESRENCKEEYKEGTCITDEWTIPRIVLTIVAILFVAFVLLWSVGAFKNNEDDRLPRL